MQIAVARAFKHRPEPYTPPSADTAPPPPHDSPQSSRFPPNLQLFVQALAHGDMPWPTGVTAVLQP